MGRSVISGLEAKRILFEGISAAGAIARKRLGPKGASSEGCLTASLAQLISGGSKKAVAQEALGLYLAKSLADKLQERYGAGASMAVVLLEATTHAFTQELEAGASAHELLEGFEHATRAALCMIEESSKPLKSSQEALLIAKNALLADQEEVSKLEHSLIQALMEQIGEHCDIHSPLLVALEERCGAKEAPRPHYAFKRSSALAVPSSDASARFLQLRSPFVLLSNESIEDVWPLSSLFHELASKGRDLLIIAPSITTGALPPLLLKNRLGALQVASIALKNFSSEQIEQLSHLAQTTITSPKHLRLKELGQLQEVHLSYLGHHLFLNQTPPPKEGENELLNAFTILLDPHLKRFERPLQRALSRSFLAAQSGVHWGAGMAYARAAQSIDPSSYEPALQSGVRALCKALKAPHQAITHNAGYNGERLTHNMLEYQAPWEGFDLMQDEVCSLPERGIMDPTDLLLEILSSTKEKAREFLLAESLILA